MLFVFEEGCCLHLASEWFCWNNHLKREVGKKVNKNSLPASVDISEVSFLERTRYQLITKLPKCCMFTNSRIALVTLYGKHWFNCTYAAFNKKSFFLLQMATNESLLYRENFSISDSYGTRSRRTGSVQCLQVIFCGLNVLFMVRKHFSVYLIIKLVSNINFGNSPFLVLLHNNNRPVKTGSVGLYDI